MEVGLHYNDSPKGVILNKCNRVEGKEDRLIEWLGSDL